MDDELPLFIFLTTQINIKNIFAEINLIEDYLKYSKNIDKESMVITKLKVLFLFFYFSHLHIIFLMMIGI